MTSTDSSDGHDSSEQLEEGPGEQRQPWPGEEGAMDPRADHGEDSYTGQGRLKDKVALITGGDSGIGRAVAIAYAREGADVFITHLDEEADARETVKWIERAGRRGVSLRADLTSRDACRDVVARTASEAGRLDILVNNAAYQCEQGGIHELTPEQVERTFRTNILAYLWVAQAALEHLPDDGVIINTGSVTAQEGNGALIDYSATKGAIHTFTKSLAESLSYRGSGIRVNCVAPGPVWTPLIPATLDPEHVASFGTDTLVGRAAQPAELAPTYVLLASDGGNYYRGEILSMTGRATSR